MIPALLLMRPALKEAIWGGSQLQRRYGKDAPVQSPIGESWEVSCLPGMDSIDEHSQRPLSDLFRQNPGQLLGPEWVAGSFPLLLKLIATKSLLSLQVHPNDDEAAALEGRGPGKREAWLVLEADPESFLYLGLNEGVELPDLRRAIQSGQNAQIEPLLRRIQPRPGDVYDVAPGTLHAIGPGLVMLEIQQASDVTYRVWDWGRVGSDGVPRPLHVEKAFQVARPTLRPEALSAPTPSRRMPGSIHLSHEDFHLETWQVDGMSSLLVRSLWLLTCLAGEGTLEAAGLEPVRMTRGCTVVVPRGAALVHLNGRGMRLSAVTLGSAIPGADGPR